MCLVGDVFSFGPTGCCRHAICRFVCPLYWAWLHPQRDVALSVLTVCFCSLITHRWQCWHLGHWSAGFFSHCKSQTLKMPPGSASFLLDIMCLFILAGFFRIGLGCEPKMPRHRHLPRLFLLLLLLRILSTCAPCKHHSATNIIMSQEGGTLLAGRGWRCECKACGRWWPPVGALDNSGSGSADRKWSPAAKGTVSRTCCGQRFLVGYLHLESGWKYIFTGDSLTIIVETCSGVDRSHVWL